MLSRRLHGREATMKNCLMRLLAGAALLAFTLPCSAQAYPAKPILMLMPLQAGSAVDVMIRIVAQKMGENLGQQIGIQNQPGAAGLVLDPGLDRKSTPLNSSHLVISYCVFCLT